MTTPNPVTEIYNYRLIDSQLATSGQPNEAQLGAIAAEGYEVIINLALHDDPRYPLKDETGTGQALGLNYVHIPVKFDAPTAEDLHAFFRRNGTSRRPANLGTLCSEYCAKAITKSRLLGR